MPPGGHRLVIAALPDAAAADRVVALLLQIARNGDERRLRAALARLPATIAAGLAAEKAERVAERLRAAGAEVQVEADPAPAEAAEPGTGPGTGSGTDVAEPAAPAAAPVAIPATRRTTVLLTALLASVTLFYLLTLSPLAPFPLRTPPPLPAPRVATAPPAAPAEATGAAAAIPADDPLALPLRLPPDRRLADGLREALRLQLRLAGRGGDEQAVEVSLLPAAADGEYRLTYAIAGSALPKGMRERGAIDVAAGPAGIGAALLRLAEAVAPPAAPPSPAAGEPGEPAEPVSRTLLPPELPTAGLIEALHDLGGDPAVAAGSPLPFIQGAEGLAWLAFFKGAVPASALPSRLAVHALAHYLTAAARGAGPGQLAYTGALVALALGYPGAALDALNQADGEEVPLLRAYLRLDLATLERLAAAEEEPRLATYLLARAAVEGGEERTAQRLLRGLLGDHPDFLLAKEYALLHGDIALTGQYRSEYREELLEGHLALLGTLLDPAALSGDDQLATLVRQPPVAGSALTKWTRLHGRLLARPLRLKGENPLLGGEEVAALLREEMIDSLRLEFAIEAERYARLPQAGEVAELAAAAYPASPLGLELQLRLLHKYRDYEGTRRFLQRPELGSADAALTDRLLTVYDSWVADWHDLPQTATLLGRLRELAPPTPAALGRLALHYQRLHLLPQASALFQAAAAAAPWSLQPYRDAAGAALEALDPERQEARLGHLPELLLLLGDRRRERGENDGAIGYYRRAIALDPGDDTPYFRLAALLEKLGRDDEAIAVRSDYLARDDRSLAAVHMANAIAALDLKHGRVEAAYARYDKAKESGQNAALQGFALAAERSGRTLQAEQYFTQAAERYPVGSAPAALALFHLRRGNRATAVAVLRKYRAIQDAGFYFEPLIEQSERQGDPAAAIALVREVAPDDWQDGLIATLAQLYERRGHPAIAAGLWRGPATRFDGPGKSYPYLYVADYLRAAEAAEPGATPRLVEELLAVYRRVPQLVENFGVSMLAAGRPEVALPIFAEEYRSYSRRRDVALVMMALAWRLAGGGDGPARRQIATARDTEGENPWLRRRLAFLLGELPAAELLAAAETPSRRCEGHYLAGAVLAAGGDAAAAERELIAALATRSTGDLEYMYAYRLLQKIAR